MILLTFQPRNCMADCPTKASAKADNLIIAVQTGKLLDVDIHPEFRTLMEHKAFWSTWCKTFLHTKEKEVFFLNTFKISVAQTLQEGPFQVMFAGTQHIKEQKELNTRERRGQDTTKTTSALRRVMYPISSVFDSHEPLCLMFRALFFQSGNHDDANVTLALSQSSEGQPNVSHNLRFFTSTRQVGYAHGRT